MATTASNTTGHHRYLADDDEHERYTSVGVDGLLAASEKLLAMNRGLAEADARDALPNDRVYTVDKLMAERIKLDHGRLLRNMMGRLGRARNLTPLGPDALSGYTLGYVDGNPLAPALEEINPMHILEGQRRITKMGPGGIGDTNAITASMQAVDASQFGFIDPSAGPECFREDHEVLTRRGWVAWPDVTESDEFASDGAGWVRASRIVRERYCGRMIAVVTSAVVMVVTPTHRVLVRDGDVSRFSRAQDVFGREAFIPCHAPTDIALQIFVGVEAHEWQSLDYDGMVYCATVPDGKLYVRGSATTHAYWSGNSERAGIDTRLAWGARIGSDGKIYQKMRNRRTGKMEWVSPTQLQGKTLKLPD